MGFTKQMGTLARAVWGAGSEVPRRAAWILLAALLGPAFATAASPPFREGGSYPSPDDLVPLRASMQGFHDATIYRITSPPQPLPPGYSPDSPGTVMGYPILYSVTVRRGSWFDSLSQVVLNPRNYLDEERACIVFPSLAVRLRGERDSLTLFTGSNCGSLLVRTGSGAVIAGWVDDAGTRETLTALTERELDAPARPPDPEASLTTIDAPDPVYPDEAKAAGIEGRVVLQVLVGVDGRVKNVKVIRSVPFLDKAATDAVRKWTFEPARAAGKPVASWVQVPIEFRLPRER